MSNQKCSSHLITQENTRVLEALCPELGTKTGFLLYHNTTMTRELVTGWTSVPSMPLNHSSLMGTHTVVWFAENCYR